jgi:hypothetical protein
MQSRRQTQIGIDVWLKWVGEYQVPKCNSGIFFVLPTYRCRHKGMSSTVNHECHDTIYLGTYYRPNSRMKKGNFLNKDKYISCSILTTNHPTSEIQREID